LWGLGAPPPPPPLLQQVRMGCSGLVNAGTPCRRFRQQHYKLQALACECQDGLQQVLCTVHSPKIL
jgi:hypothetical protein